MNFDAFLASIQAPALRAIAQHWHEARSTALLPSWDALRLEQLPQPARLIWIYAYDPGTGKFTGRLSGEQTTRASGKSFHGLPLELAHTGAIYLWVHQALTRVVSEPAAYRSSGKLYNRRPGSSKANGSRCRWAATGAPATASSARPGS